MEANNQELLAAIKEMTAAIKEMASQNEAMPEVMAAVIAEAIRSAASG